MTFSGGTRDMNDIPAVLARAQLVWVIPTIGVNGFVAVTCDLPAGRTAWTFPSGARRHPRVPTDVVARRVLRTMLACDHRDLRLIAAVDPPPGRAPAAVYTARVTWPGPPPMFACCGRHRIGEFRIGAPHPPIDLRPTDLAALLTTGLDTAGPILLRPTYDPRPDHGNDPASI
jgi:hypothetical protein